MTGGIYLLEHLWFLWWSFPVLTKGGHSLLSVHSACWTWLRWADVVGVLSELSALISAVSLKWCQWHSISSKMNSCPAWRPSQQLNFVGHGGLQVNLYVQEQRTNSCPFFFSQMVCKAVLGQIIQYGLGLRSYTTTYLNHFIVKLKQDLIG